jgi:Tfp pilus assembly protein PilF
METMSVKEAMQVAVECHRAGRLAEAEEICRQILAVRPNHAHALHLLGVLARGAGQADAAIDLFQRAILGNPLFPEAFSGLGGALMEKARLKEAVVAYQQVTELTPGDAEAFNNLGTALKALGKFEEASSFFRRAIAIRPDAVLAYFNLSATGYLTADDGEIKTLQELLSQTSLPMKDRIVAGFTLGEVLDAADRYDEAFAQYAAANLLIKQTKAAQGKDFDGQALHRQVDKLIEVFTSKFFASRREWGDPSELPVFVMGMPRSGTSLVEQIAASHPSVLGAGELNAISNISNALGERCGPAAWEWDTASVSKAAREYLSGLKKMGPGAARVIDKMPGNVLLLGVIATLFPNARIIFCKRDACDTCLSCYFQWFTQGGFFATDLADCGHQYLEFERITAHWRAVLPLRMLEVEYETLVGDLEGQSRRLIDFLGLPWDAACLNFHRTERPVFTASDWQVRQPIYKSSVGRWRHYEKYLDPLLKVLGIKQESDNTRP